MNTYVFALVAAVAVMSQSASAQFVCNNLLPAPILSPICSGPIVSPIAPIVPTTTIVQTNSVTNSLVDTLQMLTVTNLLNNQLPLCPNLLAAPVVPCGCGCGYGTIFF